jgi:hypothetical protein
MAAALLIALAFVADLRNLGALQRTAGFDASPEGIAESVAAMVIDIATATNRVPDKAGRFSVASPSGWQFQTGAEVEPYALKALGPGAVEFRVQVGDLPAEHLGLLKSQLRGIEQDLDAETHIEAVEFQGRPALRRTCRIRTQTLYMLDFPLGRHAYHFLFAVPGDSLPTFQPVIDELLSSVRLPAAPKANRPPGA